MRDEAVVKVRMELANARQAAGLKALQRVVYGLVKGAHAGKLLPLTCHHLSSPSV